MITLAIDVKFASSAGQTALKRSQAVLDDDALSFLVEAWLNDLFQHSPWHIECLRREPTVPGATHAYVFSVQSGGSNEQARSDMALFVSLLGSCVAMLDLPFAAVQRMSFDYGALITSGFGPDDRERIDQWLVAERAAGDDASCRVDFGVSASRGYLGGENTFEALREVVAQRLEDLAIGTVAPDGHATRTESVVSVLLVRPTVVAVAMLTFAILESLDRLISFSALGSDVEPTIVANLVHLRSDAST